jgi:hypothetical protein
MHLTKEQLKTLRAGLFQSAEYAGFYLVSHDPTRAEKPTIFLIVEGFELLLIANETWK